MKILHTADWHIGQFKGPVEDGVNLRFKDTVNCLEYMVAKAREEKPDIVCVSGDIFHQEQIGPVRYSDEMVTATNIIEELSQIAKFVVVMRGTPNHDGSGQFRVLTKMLEHNKKVAVVTTPQVISTPVADFACIPGFDKQEFRAKFPGLSADEENLTWTQYISDMVLGLRAQCSYDQPAILMAHYTVPGCNMESGQTSFFANFEPVIPREAIQTANYDGVFLGHIHRPQPVWGLNDTFYSGAINAMNFNDEGQERGFYVHTFSGRDLADSLFIQTPYRNFLTIKWEKEDVEEYLRSGRMSLMDGELPDRVTDSIVRVRYSCTTDQKKALNIPALQADLYSIGAFYVADIEAESTVDTTNRGLMKEEEDPLVNLKKWLDEKCYKDSDKITELAEPIIAAAMKQSSTAEIHGVFKPVSITVRNYRSYKEESFDFSDISFCTINGVNGAGKSSLFMDAIVDCLYEETRDGDNKSWIRGTEDARSGSIEFVFEIGNARFRVVRTRTKSGKPTLNLSQMDENGTEWLNLSKERVIDTQAEIEKVLGMDSMTFRSCALIMQDQYGLFLQAKKDERIAILGNLLGLGIYGVMEFEARRKLKEERGILMSKKSQVATKQEFIDSKGNPAGELEDIEKAISDNEDKVKKLSEESAQLQAIQTGREAVLTRKREAEEAIAQYAEQRRSAESRLFQTEAVISACKKSLEDAESIRSKAAEYEETRQEAEGLKADTVRYEAGSKTLQDYTDQKNRYENIISNSEIRIQQAKQQIRVLREKIEEGIEEKLAELDTLRTEQDAMREQKNEYLALSAELRGKKDANAAEIHKVRSEISLVNLQITNYEQSEKYIANSNCPHIETASCKFLEKAKADVSALPDARSKLTGLEETLRNLQDALRNTEAEYAEKMNRTGYDPEREKELAVRIQELSIYQQKKSEAEEAKLSEARLTAEIDADNKTIAQCKENLYTVNIQASRVQETVDTLKDAVDRYNEATKRMAELESYVEQEKQLPVYEERLANAEEKADSIRKEISDLKDKEKAEADKQTAADGELNKFPADLDERMRLIDIDIHKWNDLTARLQITKGTLMQKVEDINNLKDEIDVLNEEIINCSKLADYYDILKLAFSQDGVPHQIIRNIIPYITDTANNILGAMTGGTMGVEFIMEKMVKGKDGEKATLDVLIDEYGKTKLPYASKSGGEKVKASLAVILALAEIKTSAAGIQLGMLFIDEPPFLDKDGTQAYMDSLETIRQRYPDVKIMAITHDEAMKARFSQDVTVIKTDDGSKVVY